MSLQKHIFLEGKKYRARRGFKSGPFEFFPGEILIFERDGYSIYDSCFVYEFRSQIDGKLKGWWLNEEEPADKWLQYFEMVSN